jgi:membrane fusion protein
LRYEAFPYQKFGVQEARVVDVSLAQIAPDQIPENLPVQSREGLYRVTVALKKQYIKAYQENKPLIAGMVVEADLLQESRTLIEWILEPLIATTARLNAPKADSK